MWLVTPPKSYPPLHLQKILGEISGYPTLPTLVPYVYFSVQLVALALVCFVIMKLKYGSEAVTVVCVLNDIHRAHGRFSPKCGLCVH